MLRLFSFILLLLLFSNVLGQSYTFRGKISDQESLNALEGANIYFYYSKQGVISDKNGVFSLLLNLPKDSVIISYLGYKTQYLSVQNNIPLRIQLLEEENLLEEAVIEVDRNPIKNTQSGEIKLSARQIEKLPLIMGERDIIKTLQFVPGVQAGKEGQTGLFIRGGNSSMNLFLIDDIYIHNISHLGGFFSAINSDIISNLTFVRSGIPAYYGGRLSSVTAIETSSSCEQIELKGGIGTVSSQLDIKIPIRKINTSIQLSARRTYFDLIQPFFRSENENSILNKNISTSFYDGFIKTETKFNNNNRISLEYFRTKDDFHDISTENKRVMDWGNDLFGIEWKHIFTSRLYSKFKLSNSNYRYNFEGLDFPYKYSILSKINISSFKNTNTLRWNIHKLVFGIEYNYTIDLPKDVSATLNSEPLLFNNVGNFYSHNPSLFVSDRISFSEKFTAIIGLRLSSFLHVGSYKNYNSSKQYAKNELVKAFVGFEPRLSLNYELNKSSSIKLSYHRIFQYFHQATLSTFSLPVDFYYPSTVEANPQESNQITIGLNKLFKGIDFALEAYYNNIRNLSEFKNGSVNNLFNDNMYGDIVFGKAQSVGLEFSVHRKWEGWTGLLSYALSKSISQFPQINGGEWFSSTFDRPHNLNSLVSYTLNKKWSFSITFIFTSGQNFTAPSDIRIINESPVISYAKKNSMRYPNYHRADVSVSYQLRAKKLRSSVLNLTIYNVYNNKNPFLINYKISGGYQEKSIQITPSITTLFPFLPTISWRFNF